MPLEAIRTVASRVPEGAIVFVDEAYAEFSGVTSFPNSSTIPNVVVGRTFSKAFGLAGLRIGAITGHPDALEPIRLAIPVYSVNIAAVAAVQAALTDLAHPTGYARRSSESKALLYAACDRLGLRYWRSAANFVLVVRRAMPNSSQGRSGARHLPAGSIERTGTGWLLPRRRPGSWITPSAASTSMEEVLCAAE